MGGTKQDDWPERRQKPGKLCPYKEFKLPKDVTLSEFALEPFSMFFPVNFCFTFYLLPPHLNSSLTRQARQGTLALTAGPCGQWLGLPVWEAKTLLPATAHCRLELGTSEMTSTLSPRVAVTSLYFQQQRRRVPLPPQRLQHLTFVECLTMAALTGGR